MNVICIGLGDAHMGRREVDRDGNVISLTEAHWELNSEGGCVAIWSMIPETKEYDGPADVFGDWDAARYLARALELLHPRRQVNLPDLKSIIQAAEKDDFNICNYCSRYAYDCRDCIITEWKEDGYDE